MSENRPSRAAALAWVRGHCPDLEIQEGPGWHRAHFTHEGRDVIVDVEGPGSRDEIAQRVFGYLRGRLGVPVKGEDDLVQRIVSARAAGDDKLADELEREFMARAAGVRSRGPRRVARGRVDMPGIRDLASEEYLPRSWGDRKVR